MKFIKKLTFLELSLNRLGLKSYAQAVQQIRGRLPKNPQGEIPTFEWLKDGLFGKFYRAHPDIVEEFIELNSGKLAQFGVEKYLGSGKIGDVWLLDDGNVLKIFNSRATVHKRTDTDKYEEVADLIFEGEGGIEMPMIYEQGEFNLPDEMYVTRSPNEYPWNTPDFIPRYVIMENLKTIKSFIETYIDQSGEIFEPKYTYDEDGEIEDVIVPERPIDIDSEIVNMWLTNREPEPGDDPAEYVDFLKKYLVAVTHVFIHAAINQYEVLVEEQNDDEEDPEDEIDLDDPESRRELADRLLWDWESYTDADSDVVGQMEEMLGLPMDWKEQLTRAIVEQIYLGRKDLHAENFGFRNNHVVFFDA